MAAEKPVARVLVEVPLAHLDRPFDYAVPAHLAAAALPGCRVRVRFAGKDVGGFLLDRASQTEHTGTLTPLRRVVSDEPVLTAQVARLCRAVADRYAGVVSDVLRLAVPPRQARVEREDADPPADVPMLSEPAPRAAWEELPEGDAFLDRIRMGAGPRAVATVGPGDWPLQLAQAATVTLASDRGAVICVPDVRDVQRVARALSDVLGAQAKDVVALLTADLGPARRYRAFLRVLRGHARIVVGTRAAAFAPVRDLGLVAVWDDGDDLHAEPHAPYPHTREVLAQRAYQEKAAFLIAAHARTAEAQLLVDTGWAQTLEPSRTHVRGVTPQVHVTGESDTELARDPVARAARLPNRAFEVARAALADGPVLVQVPRVGYLPALSCVACRHPARCGHCQGPLSLSQGQRTPACRWCGRVAAGWRCTVCGHNRFRAPVVGSQRTADELGRAFPRTPVLTSTGGHARDRVDASPALVVATPGAEPVADEGYAAALLLDTWLSLARPDLRAAEESLRRWLNAAALVRRGEDGGRVVVVGDPAVTVVQALVRWDPVGAAVRELSERAAARLPPAAKTATVSGAPDAVTALVTTLALPRDAEVLGPLPVDDDVVRAVVRAPRDQAPALVAALKSARAGRSARKDAAVRVQVDPVTLG